MPTTLFAALYPSLSYQEGDIGVESVTSTELDFCHAETCAVFVAETAFITDLD